MYFTSRLHLNPDIMKFLLTTDENRKDYETFTYDLAKRLLEDFAANAPNDFNTDGTVILR